MKTVALVLSVLIGSSSWGWADDLAMAKTPSNTTNVISAGIVKTVSWADSTRGTISEIVVINASKKPTNIYVTSTTTLWDSDAKAILQDRVVTRSHINVIYLTTPEGLNVAKSIKVLK